MTNKIIITKEQKEKALKLIAEAEKLGEGIDDYDSESEKYPRQAFEDLYDNAKDLYCEITNKKNDFNSNCIYWHYDGDWYFEATNYTEKLEELLKNEKK